MRFPISPFQGTRSRPGNSLPNLMHFTIRVPGATGSADGAGLQLSSAIKVLRSSPNIHLTATPANCLERRASKLFRFRVFSWTQSSIHKSPQPGGAHAQYRYALLGYRRRGFNQRLGPRLAQGRRRNFPSRLGGFFRPPRPLLPRLRLRPDHARRISESHTLLSPSLVHSRRIHRVYVRAIARAPWLA